MVSPPGDAQAMAEGITRLLALDGADAGRWGGGAGNTWSGITTARLSRMSTFGSFSALQDDHSLRRRRSGTRSSAVVLPVSGPPSAIRWRGEEICDVASWPLMARG